MRTRPRDVVQWTWPYTSAMAPLCIQTHAIIRPNAIISQPSFPVLTLRIWISSPHPLCQHFCIYIAMLKKEWLSPWLYNFHSIVDFFFIAVIEYHEQRGLEVEGFWGSYGSRRIKDMPTMVRKHDSRQAWLQKLLRAHSLKHKQEAERELGMECVLETQKSTPIDTLPSSKPHFLNVGVWIKLAP